jgi:hypothetical protein
MNVMTVTGGGASLAPVPFKREPPPLPSDGNIFMRAVTASVLAAIHRSTPSQVAAERWPHDRLLAEILTRAAAAPAMTTVAGWAAELAQRHVVDAIEAFGATVAGPRLLQECLLVAFERGTASVPAITASANHADWVAEGEMIPVRQLAATAAPLDPYKIASICTLTREMTQSSNLEALIRDTLIAAAGLRLDATLFDSAAGTAVRPAGLRNGIAALTASTNTDLVEAGMEDMATLINAIAAIPGPYILVASAGRVVGMHGRIRGASESDDFLLLPSPAAGNDLIAVAAGGIAAALDPNPEIEVASQASLHMDDVPSATPSAGPRRSLFQTDSLGIKMRWPVSWVRRTTAAVAWLTPSWK